MTRIIFTLLTIAMLAASCSSSDDTLTGNDNANNNSVKYSTRIEIPRISDYSNFRVRTTTVNSKENITYSIEHSPERKHSRWVAFTFDASNRGTSWKRDNWKNTAWGGDPFQPDPDFDSDAVFTKEEINRNGYVRGHLVASYDRVYSQNANEQTFYYSNISPMLSRFNTGIWNELEQLVQNWGRNKGICDTLYIVKGGTINEGCYTEKTNNQGLTCRTVPRYYYMALLCRLNDTYSAIGFWFEHKNSHSGTLTDYAMSIDALEEKTGIDFFCNLPDNLENSVEKSYYKSHWKGLE